MVVSCPSVLTLLVLVHGIVALLFWVICLVSLSGGSPDGSGSWILTMGLPLHLVLWLCLSQAVELLRFLGHTFGAEHKLRIHRISGPGLAARLD